MTREESIRPYEPIIHALEQAGHGHSFRYFSEQDTSFLICTQVPPDESGKCGESVLVNSWRGEWVLCEWGGKPAYGVAEADVVPCLLDYFADPHRPCMSVGQDLIDKYRLARHRAFEKSLGLKGE